MFVKLLSMQLYASGSAFISVHSLLINESKLASAKECFGAGLEMLNALYISVRLHY